VSRNVWFVSVLLCMLAVMMTSHLAVLGTTAAVCSEYSTIMIGKAARNETMSIELTEPLEKFSEACASMIATLSSVADQYINVILALLGGAGAAGGVAIAMSNRNEGDGKGK
jgi:hypothetical protein